MDKVRSNDYSSIEKVKALGTTALSKLETGLNITMRATDRGAFMGAYMDSIHEQLLINKVTDIKNLTYEQARTDSCQCYSIRDFTEHSMMLVQ